MTEIVAVGPGSSLTRVMGVEGELRERYDQAFEDFLGAAGLAGYSENTRRAYANAIREFFAWLRIEEGRAMAPHEVERRHAAAYLAWLEEPTWRLAHLRYLEDPVAQAVIRAVAARGTASAKELLGALPAEHRGTSPVELHRLLARMSQAGMISRSPSSDELRERLGRPFIPNASADFEGRPLHELFRYRVASVPPPAVTTQAQRVTALSALWRALARGENTAGGEPLLKHNVWEGRGARLQKKVRAHRQVAARGQRADPTAVAVLLKWLVDNPEELNSPVFLRDRALIATIALTGVRVSEALMVTASGPNPDGSRDGWIEHPQSSRDRPLLVVRRKGGLMRTLPFPRVAYDALRDFRARLATAAPGIRELLDRDDHPAFPALYRFGASARAPTRHLDRRTVNTILQRWGRRAGLAEVHVRQLHPHALRHFAAQVLLDRGRALREVQQILGHASIATTEGYLEELRDLERLDAGDDIMDGVDELASRAEPPQPREGGAIDADGVEV